MSFDSAISLLNIYFTKSNAQTYENVGTMVVTTAQYNKTI